MDFVCMKTNKDNPNANSLRRVPFFQLNIYSAQTKMMSIRWECSRSFSHSKPAEFDAISDAGLSV